MKMGITELRPITGSTQDEQGQGRVLTCCCVLGGGRSLRPASVSPELWGLANHKGVTWGPESPTPGYAVREVSLRLYWHHVPSHQVGVHRRCRWAWPLRLPYSPRGSRRTALRHGLPPSQRGDLRYSVRACPAMGHGESGSLRPTGGHVGDALGLLPFCLLPPLPLGWTTRSPTQQTFTAHLLGLPSPTRAVSAGYLLGTC